MGKICSDLKQIGKTALLTKLGQKESFWKKTDPNAYSALQSTVGFDIGILETNSTTNFVFSDFAGQPEYVFHLPPCSI